MKDTRRFKFVELFNFPVGGLLHSRTFLAKDPISTQGIAQFQEQMQDEDTGVLVLIAHLGIVDVFATATFLEKYFDFKAVFPVAASWYYFPLLKKLFDQMEPQLRHGIYPVYRKEEMGTSSTNMEMLDFSQTSTEQKRQQNKKYVLAAEQTLRKSQGVVIAAPYGGRAPQKKYLRSGIAKIVTAKTPVLLSLTQWSWKTFSYEMYFSEFQYLQESISQDALHEKIYAEFFRMSQLSGIKEKDLLGVKNPNRLTVKIWNVIVKVIKKIFPRYR